MTSKRDRVEAALSGGRADRLPVALWRHWPGDDQDAGRLAEVTIAFNKRYDWDLLKVTPSSSYCVEDWGTRTRYAGSYLGEREYLEYPVKGPEDWSGVRELEATSGALGRVLETVRLVRAGLGPDTPLLMTIFNPLAVARRLVGDETKFLAHLRSYPASVRPALEAITSTYEAFVEASIRAGADGIFLSTAAASTQYMTESEYREVGMPGDLRLLEAAKGGWINVLHLHSPYPMLDMAREYPVHAVNWDDRISGPSLGEGKGILGRAVFGGLNQWGTLLSGTPQEVGSEALDAISACANRGMLLSGGCTYPVTVPEGNLLAARHAVEEASILYPG